MKVLLSKPFRLALAAIGALMMGAVAVPASAADLIPIVPFVECAGTHGETFDVKFGYNNPNDGPPIVITRGADPVAGGPANDVNTTPGTEDAFDPSLPAQFSQGTHHAFTLTNLGAGTTVFWEVNPNAAAGSERTATLDDPATVQQCLSGLRVTKTVSNSSPQNGDTIQWTVKVTNTGRFDDIGVAVSDKIPSGLLFVTSHASQGHYDAATGEWNVGTLKVDDTETLVITTIVNSADTKTNCATATDRNGDLSGPACASETPPAPPSGGSTTTTTTTTPSVSGEVKLPNTGLGGGQS